MSFKYETQHTSPNYTPASRAQATWGQPRIVKAIAIHWWGDPNQGPSYEGVISTLVNPNRGASAHFVATGTGRRVAQLVNLEDASWATNSANPWTISIECDPRCREEDYDVVAELIANIRSAYGNIPLVPHKQFVATACPGNYDLGELDRRARLKDGSGDWGIVKDVNNEVKIGSESNWRGRFNRLHRQLVGNWDMSDEVFKSIVGQEAWKVVESWSDHSDANNTLRYQEVGQTAVKDDWSGQIKSRTAERDEAVKLAQQKTDELLAKDAEVLRLKAEISSMPTQTTPKPSEAESGTTNQPGTGTPENGLGTVFTKFIEAFKKFWKS